MALTSCLVVAEHPAFAHREAEALRDLHQSSKSREAEAEPQRRRHHHQVQRQPSVHGEGSSGGSSGFFVSCCGFTGKKTRNKTMEKINEHQRLFVRSFVCL